MKKSKTEGSLGGESGQGGEKNIQPLLIVDNHLTFYRSSLLQAGNHTAQEKLEDVTESGQDSPEAELIAIAKTNFYSRKQHLTAEEALPG